MKTNLKLDPQEIAKFSQLSSQWWNTKGPLRTLHDINPARLEFIQRVHSLTSQQVLDVGCGGGILCELLALNGAVVTGLDVEPNAITAATLHAQKSNLNINYVCQPIEEYKATTFDMITCMEMLEHVPDPAFIIEQCARLLKKNGYLFLSTINRTISAYGSVILAAEYLLNLLPRQTHDFDKFIKPSELARMVRKVGLEIVDIAGLSYNPFTFEATLQTSVAANYLLACYKP